MEKDSCVVAVVNSIHTCPMLCWQESRVISSAFRISDGKVVIRLGKGPRLRCDRPKGILERAVRKIYDPRRPSRDEQPLRIGPWQDALGAQTLKCVLCTLGQNLYMNSSL
jgi:hypothetical protein